MRACLHGFIHVDLGGEVKMWCTEFAFGQPFGNYLTHLRNRRIAKSFLALYYRLLCCRWLGLLRGRSCNLRLWSRCLPWYKGVNITFYNTATVTGAMHLADIDTTFS